jgi:hypothetical protein
MCSSTGSNWTRSASLAPEMALNALAYNMKRVMTIMGVGGLLEAMRARGRPRRGQISAYMKLLVTTEMTGRFHHIRSSVARFSHGLDPDRKSHRWNPRSEPMSEYRWPAEDANYVLSPIPSAPDFDAPTNRKSFLVDC